METEEYDVKGANQKPVGYSLSAVLSKLDKSIANYPYTAVKYLQDDADLANLTWKQRADFEYELLKYNVNRNADVATGVDSISTIFKTRDLFRAFNKKDGFKAVVLKITAILTVLALVAVILALILLVVFKLCKAPPQYTGAMARFLLYCLYLFIILTMVVFLSNTVLTRMAVTEMSTN